MSSALQAKLLHVLQDCASRGSGATGRSTSTCASSPPRTATSASWSQRGGFREDLFFRLNVVTIVIPPLRERLDELPALVDHFLRRLTAPLRAAAPPALRAAHRAGSSATRFPGNVRELENLMKRVVVLESEEPVLRDLFSAARRRPAAAASALERLLDEVESHAGEVPLREVGRRASLEAERSAIERVLFQTHWNRKQAARILGVSYKTLLQKIRECGLEAE